MEDWGSGGRTLPLTTDIRVHAQFIFPVSAGGKRDYDPILAAGEGGAEGLHDCAKATWSRAKLSSGAANLALSRGCPALAHNVSSATVERAPPCVWCFTARL